MSFTVQFTLIDAMNRIIRRSFNSTHTTVADVITEVAVLAPLWDAITTGGLQGVSITQKSTATTFAAAAGSNRDTGMTLTLATTGPSDYGMKIPMPIDALKLPGGQVDTANAALLAFIAEFQAAGTWRVNLDNPVAVTSIVKGVIDK